MITSHVEKHELIYGFDVDNCREYEIELFNDEIEALHVGVGKLKERWANWIKVVYNRQVVHYFIYNDTNPDRRTIQKLNWENGQWVNEWKKLERSATKNSSIGCIGEKI